MVVSISRGKRLRKEHAKGGLEMQNVVNNFSEYERVEKEKQRRNIRLSHGMKT